jgi:hypothetical protein
MTRTPTPADRGSTERGRSIVEAAMLDIVRHRSAPRVYVLESDGEVVLCPPRHPTPPAAITAILGDCVADIVDGRGTGVLGRVARDGARDVIVWALPCGPAGSDRFAVIVRDLGVRAGPSLGTSAPG